MRRQCKGHGEECLWLSSRSTTQEVTSDMEFTQDRDSTVTLYNQIRLIGENLSFRQRTSDYVNRPCKGHGIGCLWLHLLKPNMYRRWLVICNSQTPGIIWKLNSNLNLNLNSLGYITKPALAGPRSNSAGPPRHSKNIDDTYCGTNKILEDCMGFPG